MKGFKGSLGKFNKISAVMKAKNAGRLAVRLAEGRSALKNLLSMTKGAAKYGKYLKYGKSALKLIPFVDGAINIYQAYLGASGNAVESLCEFYDGREIGKNLCKTIY